MKGVGCHMEIISRQQRKIMIMCILSTFAIGLIAHAYGFFNSIYSHDTLNALVAGEAEELWKIRLGRFMVPLYRQIIRPPFAMPWLIGFLALLYLSAVSYLICDMLNIKSLLPVCAVSGILSTNLTVIVLTAVFIYELDLDILALLLCVTAVYSWRKHRLGFLWGIILIAVSLGFYQAYISAAVVLILICLMMDCLDNLPFRIIVISGLKAVIMLIGAGVVYVVLLRTVLKLTNTTLAATYNGLTRLFLNDGTPFYIQILQTYEYYFNRLLHMIPAFAEPVELVINIVLFSAGAFTLGLAVKQKKTHKTLVACIAVLLVLFPFGTAVLYMLSHGMMHELMIFSVAFTYLLFIVLLHRGAGDSKGSRVLRAVSYAFTFIIIWGNVQSANVVYLKKDLDTQSALSIMTRAVERIETHEDYIPGETPVAFVGEFHQDILNGFEDYLEFTGGATTPAKLGVFTDGSYNTYKAYIRNILNIDMNLVDDDTWDRLWDNDALRQGPAFPEKGCIQFVDHILVVNMGH